MSEKNEKSGQAKERNNHSAIKFTLICIGCALLGVLIGIAVNFIRDGISSLAPELGILLTQYLPLAQWIVFVALAIISVLLFGAARTAIAVFERGKGANVAVADRAEWLLSWGMLIANFNMVLCLGLAGICCCLQPLDTSRLLISGALLIVVSVYISVYNTYAVKLVKRLNPEKEGDPLTYRFQKDWLNSCDEGELFLIYKSALASMKAVSRILLALWLITVIIGMFWDIGIYPMLLITVVWLVHSLSYQYSAIDHPRKKTPDSKNDDTEQSSPQPLSDDDAGTSDTGDTVVAADTANTEDISDVAAGAPEEGKELDGQNPSDG